MEITFITAFYISNHSIKKCFTFVLSCWAMIILSDWKLLLLATSKEQALYYIGACCIIINLLSLMWINASRHFRIFQIKSGS